MKRLNAFGGSSGYFGSKYRPVNKVERVIKLFPGLLPPSMGCFVSGPAKSDIMGSGSSLHS
jgi:hypothetical protein